jgi:PAS domain S-box-containing protein
MHPSQYLSARGEFGEQSVMSGRRQRQQQNDARYQALLNSDSTGIYSCDATGLITYYNKQAAELWGRQPIMGDTCERFCGSLMLFRLDGRYLPHDQSPMADVLAGKVAGIYDAEVHIQRPDGSRVVVIVNIAPLIDDNGIVAGAFCSFCENPLRKRRK